MSNSWFQFKQFRIDQDQCAMKVTTDACIQGAWTPIRPGVRRVMDIGAGTSLLSLMLAQRGNELQIDAIESDTETAEQAHQNILQSRWLDRITVIEADVRNYPFSDKYDLIICNPPFFNNNLLGPDDKKNSARHTLSLSYEDLLEVLDINLDENGYASILLPFPEYQKWRVLMIDNQWLEVGKLNICHKPGARVNRVVSVWGRAGTPPIAGQELIIKDNENKYTPEFVELLRPFYLEP